jgi:LuxR family transcriptional regulator
MLTLSRSHEPLTASEIVAQEKKMKWLVHVVHMALSRLLSAKRPERAAIKLTAREVEILKWTADGKSSQDIADILLVSKNTIDFHVKNAVAKLQTANKTAAVVRAAVLGLLI